ncbi:MAG: hypothetical protein ACSHX5_07260 [Phycisphaerales bacterium]
MNHTYSKSHSLVLPLIIAIALLIVSGATALASRMEIIENQAFPRMIGISFGIILISIANYFPKRVYTTCSPSAVRRIAWLFVIAGLLYIGVWITGDTSRTELLAALVFAPACLVSMVMYQYAHLSSNNTEAQR